MAAMGPTEELVGITEYMSQLPGFSGIVKHRYKDFQVNEVGLDGVIAELSPEDWQPRPPPPPPPVPPPAQAQQPGPSEQQEGDKGESKETAVPDDLEASIPAALEAFSKLAGDESSQLLGSLLTAITERKQGAQVPAEKGSGTEAAGTADGSTNGSSPAAATAAATAAPGGVEKCPDGSLKVTLPAIKDKDKRKAVHEFFKSNPALPSLTTHTACTGAPAPKATPAAQNQRGRGGARGGRGGGRWAGRGGGRGEQVEADKPTGSAPTEGRIEIVWQPRSRGGGQSSRGRGRGDRGGGGVYEKGWGGEAGESFVKFVLYKENMDTQLALNNLGRAMHLAPRTTPWGFAGTKDKRALTAQWVTAFKITPAKLAGVNTLHWLRNVKVGKITYCKQPLELGDLLGNRFHILMRDCCPLPGPEAANPASSPAADKAGLEAQLLASCQALADNGFINYFGLQRFGTAGTPTHLIGASLIRGEFCKAVDLVMAEGSTENGGGEQGGSSHGFSGTGIGAQAQKPEVQAARQAWLKNRDPQAAARGLPQWMVAERSVMSALAYAVNQNSRGARQQGGAGNQQQGGSGAAGKRPAEQSPAAGAAAGGDAGASCEGGEQPAKKAKVEGSEQGTGSAGGAGPKQQITERMAADALATVPKTLKLMYMHAWQSRIWNMAASQRIKVYGSKVVAGDLVLPLPKGTDSDQQSTARKLANLVGKGESGAGDVDSAKDSGGRGGGRGGRGGRGGQDSRRGRGGAASQAAVHVVTPEEAESGVYCIQDVVLPLPGSQVQYPQHMTAHVYRDQCAADGVDIPLPKTLYHDASSTQAGAAAAAGGSGAGAEEAGRQQGNEQGQKRKQMPTGSAATFGFNTMSGDYRRLMMKPLDFRYRLLRYADPNDDSLLPVSLSEAKAPGGAPAASPAPGGPGGPYLGLHLDFTLPPSAYGTMLIREITRQSSARAYQAGLTMQTFAAAAATKAGQQENMQEDEQENMQEVDEAGLGEADAEMSGVEPGLGEADGPDKQQGEMVAVEGEAAE